MNRFHTSPKWSSVCAAILTALFLGGACSANAEKDSLESMAEALVSLGPVYNQNGLGIREAKKRMETKISLVVDALSSVPSKIDASELQKLLETCKRCDEPNAYIFFVEKYQISAGYEKFKISAHPNPGAAGIFARKNIVAMSYIPKEDFFEEDCKKATIEGTWLGPYRNTNLTEQEGTYQICRKRLFYRKMPNTDYIIVGVVIQGHDKTHAVTERPNRFIANSSRSLQTERSGVERMARVRRNAWKQARSTFAN